MEPTTIDEFRFRRFKLSREAGDETVYLPTLTERWQLPDRVSNLLCDDPRHATAAQEIFGQFEATLLDDYETWKVSVCDGSEQNEPTGALVQVDNACHLLHALVGDIEDQIAARDLKLVEQAQRLVVVRPLYRGNESGGVTTEIEHFCRVLCGGLQPEGRIWIFTTEEDEYEWRIGEISAWLEEKTKKPKDYWHGEVEGLGRAVVTGEASKLVDKLAAIAKKKNTAIIPRKSGALKPANGLERLKGKGALAQELQERLVPAYKRITDSSGATGPAIEVRIESVDDWPGECLLRQVIGTAKENPTTKEGDDP